ncbi:hypothetical protein BKA67DRAFT_695546 [Truncatella angustata]|uniref:Uncharacterized protein n=1 Tax=Truncatella angustata TaxID=152316 RepID=A0A9P8UCT4_9PEZI|nr:uncharacterized protein BKA67DRAFT_695546 [Truncatella angustata]KAH6647091.1 hypothetical protein BKA67DRAFT_695546 [Truncatella angustata]
MHFLAPSLKLESQIYGSRKQAAGWTVLEQEVPDFSVTLSAALTVKGERLWSKSRNSHLRTCMCNSSSRNIIDGILLAYESPKITRNIDVGEIVFVIRESGDKFEFDTT